MVTKNTNPFVLPGFGQSGDMASNPLLASMEMMRKAWEGMAQAGGFGASLPGSAASPEDFDRRIADLRAVENWLRMNLSLLGSTIQTLEVQRSTLATLQAFAATAGGAHSPQTPSPLDQALGIQRGQRAAPGADTSGLFGEGAKAPSGASGTQQGPASGGDGAGGSTEQTGAAGSTGGMGAGQAQTTAQAAADATIKSWWDMLQAQFDNLASATAATLQGAGAMQEAATEAQKKAADTAAAAVQAFQETASDVMASSPSTAAKATTKSTTKKAASRSGGSSGSSGVSVSTAKKATASKKAAKKTTAKKASAKKAAAGKSAKTSTKRATKTANK